MSLSILRVCASLKIFFLTHLHIALIFSTIVFITFIKIFSLLELSFEDSNNNSTDDSIDSLSMIN